MAKLNAEQLKRKYDLNNSHKDNWRSIYEDAYRYALPMRNLYDGYYESNTPGQDKMARVFDSTAIDSTQKFANRLQSGRLGLGLLPVVGAALRGASRLWSPMLLYIIERA